MTGVRSQPDARGAPRQAPPFADSGGDDIQRVKDACDLVRIVGEHIALRPKGREFVGLCPFHNDKTPSLCVIPAKQFYKCFSCGAAGDVLSFVKNYLRMEFREALEYLAQRGGITLSPRRAKGGTGTDDNPEQSGPSKRDIVQACELACVFYEELLRDPVRGLPGREVIEARGISPQMQKEFRLGASVEGWDNLVLRLSRKGISHEVLLAAGLVKQKESASTVYDAFRSRLMFPICDKAGQVIAFGARKIKPEDEPKYLNSPETRLFSKSATLYAQHLAARAMQETRTAIICEGYTDVIACHQAGFRNAVASLGTALTPLHARTLRLVCDRVVLLFDGDEAGQRATDRAAEVFFAEPIDVHVVSLDKHTDAKDPDELLKRDGGAETFRAALKAAPDLLEYRFARVRSKLSGAGMAAREKLLKEEIDKLVALGLGKGSPVRESLLRRRLAEVSGLAEATIRAAIPAGRDGSRRSFDSDQVGAADGGASEHNEISRAALALATRPLTTREHLLGCLLCDGSLWSGFTDADKDRIGPAQFDPPVREVADLLHQLGEDGDAPEIRTLLDRAPASHVQEAAIQLMSRVSEECKQDLARISEHARECWRRLALDDARATIAEYKPPAEGVLDGPAATDRLRLSIELQRKSHAALGPDRRKVPRPT